MTTRVTGRLLVLLAAAAVWILPAAARAERGIARRLAQRDELPQHRSISYVRVGHRDRRAGHPGARSPLYDLRRDTHRRAVEDDRTTASPGIPFRTALKSPRSAPLPLLPPILPSSGWVPAIRRTRARRTPARASSSPPTPARPGSRWGCWTRTTSPASSSTRRIPRSSTLRRWATCSRRTRSAACSARATAARPGTRCCMSTTAPARSTSSSIASRPTRCTRRCTRSIGLPGSSCSAVQAARVYRTDDGGAQVAEARGPSDRQRRPHRPRHPAAQSRTS